MIASTPSLLESVAFTIDGTACHVNVAIDVVDAFVFNRAVLGPFLAYITAAGVGAPVAVNAGDARAHRYTVTIAPPRGRTLDAATTRATFAAGASRVIAGLRAPSAAMTKSDANPKCERAIDIYRSWIADSPPTEPEAWDSLATSLLDEVRTRFAGVEGADDEIAAYLAACSDSLTRRNRLTATPPHSRCVWPSDDRHGRW